MQVKIDGMIIEFDKCIFRTDRAHCTEFQCTPSALSVHAFRKANHAYDLLNYQDSYLKI